MIRLVALGLLLALAAVAQPAFSGLATNRDGSKLWFSTPLRQRGTDHHAHAKIYTWDAASGFRLTLTFQIPFDAPTAAGYPELVLAGPIEGPFVASVLPQPVNIVDYGPFWYGLFPFQVTTGTPIVALHEDLHGAVTAADPAVPGEVVHVYGGGFGPVDPTPPNGEPASADPLSRLKDPAFECTVRTGVNPDPAPRAEILFAGLAPALVGTYQVSVRLPSIPAPLDPDRWPFLVCGVPNARAADGYLPYRNP